MKKLMVYLDEDMHEDLRELAFRKKTTMAALVRYALDKTYEDALDIIGAERALEEVARNPGSTMTLEDYMEQRGIELPRRDNKVRKAPARRAAG